jgi:YVTN family beta-propeller protein
MKEIFFPYMDEIAEEDEIIHLEILKAQRDPDDYNTWNRLGDRLAEKEYYVQSIACYDRATHLKPDDIIAWYQKGLSLSNLGRYEDAVKSYDKVLELDPDSIYALNSKGYALNKLAKYIEAIKYYNRVIEIDPNNTVAWYQKGLSLSNLGRYEDAVKYYDKVLELDPKNTDALNARGLALERLGRYEDAVKYYDKVLELDPKITDAWYHKGCLLLSGGKYSEAEKNFNYAYSLANANKSDNYRNAALAALRQLYSNNTYQFEKSVEISQRLLEIDPSEEKRAMLAEDYIKSGRYKESREFSFQALRNVPPNRVRSQSIIRFLILASYYMEGDSNNGNRQLTEFIEYYKEIDEDFKVDEKQWSFNGLIYSIDKNDHISFEIKTILIDLIELLQGKKVKDKVFSSMVRDFLNTNANLQHKISKLKRVVIPSISAAAFLAIIIGIFVFVLPSQQLAPCLIPKGNNFGLQHISDNNPADIAINPHINKIYVITTDAKNSNSSIIVLDCSSNKIADNNGIPLGRSQSYALAVNPITDQIYVANSNSVSVIDGSNPKNNIKYVKVGLHPYDVAVNPITNMIYVSNIGSNTTSIIDGKTNTVVKNDVKVGASPSAIAVNPQTNMVYVANSLSNTVSVINGNNPNNNIKKIDVPTDQYTTLTVDPKRSLIYVLNSVPNQFSKIDGNTDRLLSPIPVPLNITTILAGGPTIMTINTNNDQMYALNEYQNALFTTNAKYFPQILERADAGGGLPSDLTIDTKTNLAYMVNKDHNKVTIISLDRK